MAKRRYRPGSLFTNPIFALCVVVLAVFLGIKLFGGSTASGSSFYAQGVYINGVDMSPYTRSQGESRLNAWADRLVNASYTFTFEDKIWAFSPRQVDAGFNTSEVLRAAWSLGHVGSSTDISNQLQSLRVSPQMFVTELSFNQAKLDRFVDEIYDAVFIQPVDADIVLGPTRPMIVSPSVDGRELDREAFVSTLLGLMRAGSDTTLYDLPVETKLPSVSSDTAENGLQLIVTYSTSLTTSSTSRCSNVKTALNNFNGFKVAPGETVSFNEVVGERSIIRGYSEGTVYYGASVTTGVGGGVCQASSTLYGALMYAGMTTVERHHHSLVVDYCEASMDAAVSEDAMDDFVFMNDTDNAIYIYTSVINKESATVYIYSNRPEYRIDLISTITQNNIKNPNIEIKVDTSGKIAVYSSQRVLYKEGKLGRRSKLERVYYDWDTGREVKRELLSEDYYSGERDVYMTGMLTP
ncbi:MAG: VanW family protein [Clostridiales bacterium]|nr:VanW family protein [Clostridiales bacterium]